MFLIRLLKPVVQNAGSFLRCQTSLKALVLGGSAFACIAGYQVLRGQENMDAFKFGRDAQQGKLIAPVALDLTGKSAELVYIGSYIVNGHGGCNSCHTCPSYKGLNPFTTSPTLLGPVGTTVGGSSPVNTTNYLAGGVPFPNHIGFNNSSLVASNLTPDNNGLPGGLAYDDFKNAMQSGQNSHKPGHILQVMPWPIYRNLYEQDIAAIYQYLSAIPHAVPGICSSTGQTGL